MEKSSKQQNESDEPPRKLQNKRKITDGQDSTSPDEKKPECVSSKRRMALLDTAEKVEPSNWNDLPVEMKKHVLKRMSREEREALAVTSRTENKLVKSVEFVKIHELLLYSTTSGFGIEMRKNELYKDERIFEFSPAEWDEFQTKLAEIMTNVHYIRNLILRNWRWEEMQSQNLLIPESRQEQVHVGQLYAKHYDAVAILKQIMPFSLNIINLFSDQRCLGIYQMPHVINAKRFGLQNSFLNINQLMTLNATDIVLDSTHNLKSRDINTFIKRVVNIPDFEHFRIGCRLEYKEALLGLNFVSSYTSGLSYERMGYEPGEKPFAGSIPCAAGQLYLNYDNQCLEGKAMKAVIGLPMEIETSRLMKIYRLTVDFDHFSLQLTVNDFENHVTRCYDSAKKLERALVDLLEPVIYVKFLEISYRNWYSKKFRFKRNGELSVKYFQLNCQAENTMSFKLVKQLEAGFLKSTRLHDRLYNMNRILNLPQILNTKQMIAPFQCRDKNLKRMNANYLYLTDTMVTLKGVGLLMQKWLDQTVDSGHQKLECHLFTRSWEFQIMVESLNVLECRRVDNEFGIVPNHPHLSAYRLTSASNGKEFVAIIDETEIRFEKVDPNQRWRTPFLDLQL